jgi:hypothetical protein
LSIKSIRNLVLVFWALLIGWFLFVPEPEYQSAPLAAGDSADGHYWFKGNTHSHARIKVGDYVHGDSSPMEVADWYRKHGYHFVAVTDHNRFEDALSLNHSGPSDFLVMPGMEVTSDYLYPGVNQQGERRIHASAINTRSGVDWDFEDADKSEIIRLQANRTREQGGLYILNHPNYRFQLELEDILGAENVTHMEIFNAHPRSNHAGHAAFRPGVEELWDQVLSSGRLLYGVAADDAHDFKWYRQLLRRFGTAPPGGAWIMVRSPDLSGLNLTAAIKKGDFYSSTGVHLKDVLITDTSYTVVLDREKTLEETTHKWVRNAAPVIWSDDSHFVIEFIGQYGRTLHAVHDQDSASIELDISAGYIRAKVTFLDKLDSLTGADNARAYYAWTQPVITGPDKRTGSDQ